MTNARSTDIFDLLADVMVAKQKPWRRLAACKGLAYDGPVMKNGQREHMFYPIEAAGGQEAKEVCGGCPVQKQCKADHHSQPSASQHYGVWYETTALERELERKSTNHLTGTA